jgi:transcriptional regulator with XRE-family HTH domain
MAERFGDLLRRLRRKADKTLGDVARELGVSIVYLSDVERSNRKPFTNERLIKLATFLKADAEALIEAADREKGIIEYDIRRASPLQADVVGGLVAGLARGGVSDQQLESIRIILNEQRGENDDE